ncbi:hypothetical protein PILCRDRAFT_309345 [Piloderma croceum F 1598]|uniref:Uncharacterized protein n=1 Tax=Piloderma croceum (strain F 1598) TaxID=765440 RepID=A0A0C3CAC0_PILCF|nr:hypothetical protein PILCRDRAFT_309345 [Piloderma croceum F 1598]
MMQMNNCSRYPPIIHGCHNCVHDLLPKSPRGGIKPKTLWYTLMRGVVIITTFSYTAPASTWCWSLFQTMLISRTSGCFDALATYRTSACAVQPLLRKISDSCDCRLPKRV